MRRLALVCLLAAGPAQALDCTKATTRAETAICADPAARAADEDMGKAFVAATSLMSPSDKAALVAAQTRWIGERDSACTKTRAGKYAACLAQQTVRRRAFLAAEPEAGPGAPGRLAPFIHYENGARRRAAVDLQLLKYPSPATPAERAFNATVEREIGEPDYNFKDDLDGMIAWEFDRSMRLVFASPRLISARMDGYDNIGYEKFYAAGVNILVDEGREATFADLIDDKGAKAIFALCLRNVRARKLSEGDKKPNDDLAQNVAGATERLENWSFGAEAATVTYSQTDFNDYSQRPMECVIPYATLKPLAKPGFPLPDVRPRPTP